MHKSAWNNSMESLQNDSLIEHKNMYMKRRPHGINRVTLNLCHSGTTLVLNNTQNSSNDAQVHLCH